MQFHPLVGCLLDKDNVAFKNSRVLDNVRVLLIEVPKSCSTRRKQGPVSNLEPDFNRMQGCRSVVMA
ncbi:hypothetical protein M378DRAFT_169023 [Amanita muscaria Koide BX008]|uniref:Uncharacterized protein n=1 Tax=Amanita muscaria (strain Koide BX008) TaxID=946122 RepID=A0A0C2SA14_AMAMK|nr:hypothetical protein M378DRAFT_169023 [Amanita muscaria Koide BX008]